MKLRSVTYLSKEGVKNLWANRLMTIASVGVLMACMVLIGLAVLISMNVTKAVGNLEQQNVIMAYFNDKNSVLYGDASDKYDASSKETTSEETSSEIDTTGNSIPEDAYLIHNEEEAKALCEEIKKLDNVLDAVYVSSEEGLESIKEGMLEGKAEYFEFLDDEHGNPLSDAAKITLKDMSKFKETLEAIKNIKGIDSVQSQSDLADKINALKDGLGIAGIWIIAILLIISLVIVTNTIRVTMYSRKLEISIMKAVGATNSFIRLPFVVEGVAIGIISAIFSTAVLYFCYRVAMDSIGDALGIMNTVDFFGALPLIIGIFLAIGVLSGIVGSVIMISKYLKKEGSEFTAI